MWKFLIKLEFLFLIYTRHQGFAFVVFNQVAFRCVDINETLQMICTVKDLLLGAFIFHNNEKQAYCMSFPVISCESFKHGNISVTVSNDIVFTIGSREKNSLNGIWTCRNGAGKRDGNASFEIVSTQCPTKIHSSPKGDNDKSPPIIKSKETVTCNNSSVTLSCNVDTGLSVYQWTHYFDGKFIRSLNGSVQEMKSYLEIETCSYQNSGEYMCAALNKYGDTAIVANKTIVLVVNASPVSISSDVLREQLTTLSGTFYSSTDVRLTWQQSNQTLTNSTDWLQTLDKKKIQLILYNKSIECDGYMANLSIRSSFVGEYVLLIQNTFGETRVFFDVYKLGTQDMTASFDLRIVVFSIIAIGIFILSTSGTVLVSNGIRRKNVIYIIDPRERNPTIPIYHSAPAFDNTQNAYDILETGYLQVTNEQYELNHFQDTENESVDNYTLRSMSSNYEEIDV